MIDEALTTKETAVLRNQTVFVKAQRAELAAFGDDKNALRKVDPGLVHSSAADSLVALVAHPVDSGCQIGISR